MKRVVPRRLVIFGGLAGLILGSLIVVGFLAAAHLQNRRGEGEADAILTAERQLSESTEESSGESSSSSSKEAPAQEPPFPSTTWGLVGRIAAAQLEAGDEDGSRRTMALIPAKEGTSTRVYRTHLDRAYNNMLNAVLQERWNFSSRPADPVPLKVRLKRAEAVAEKLGEGVPRAGAWMRIAEWVGRRPKVQESEGKTARDFLTKAVAEVGKVQSEPPDAGRLSRAWEEVGGGLMLCWPLGLTVLGTLGGEMIRKAFESFAEDFGESAAGWLGRHHHPAGADHQAESPAPAPN